MNDRPMVSIWCITYNHEKYIKDAIESFLMQKTDFNFEIVIHDDASTDGTVLILREYEKKYPELIRVIYELENQYSKFQYPPQFFNSLMRKELKGKYIAWCEGDDYWTDSEKLQTQVHYMESHTDCVMTVHDAIRRNCSTGEERQFRPLLEERDVSFFDCIGASIPTASYICKKEMLNMSEFFLETDVGDYPLQLYCLTKGKIHYFDRVMSVYRSLAEGSWSSSQGRKPDVFFKHSVDMSFFLENYNIYTNGVYSEHVKRKIKYWLNRIPSKFHHISIEQFHDICEKLDSASGYKMHKYYVEVMRGFRQYCDLTYLDKRMLDFVERNKYVLIWGAGDYGAIIAEQFRNNGIKYEGFVVSDNQDTNEMYQDKKVWKISNLPYEKEKVGIVIAVRWQLKEEILKVLYIEKEIKSYIYPFEINVEYLIDEERMESNV